MTEKVVAIIQARMGSKRLPGKTMLNICAKPLLFHILERNSHCKRINHIVVATTNNHDDDIIVEFCKKNYVKYFRGAENDVLDRYYKCAIKNQADIIVRITADNPFQDPVVNDKVISIISKNPNLDYVSNKIEPTFPIGLDIEALRFKALKRIWWFAKKPEEREHVTAYILRNRHLFRTENLKNDRNLLHLRWTLDTKEDFFFVNEIYKKLYSPSKLFYMKDILDLLGKHPKLLSINSNIKQRRI